MRIILSGGGSGEKSKELDTLFSSLLDKNKPLLYIPIAIDAQKHPYPECLKWLKGTFDKLNVSKYVMWTEEELENIKESPEKFSGVYIGGGNTFYLLKILKETGFWNLLKEFIKKDIPIYGGSAGAIIFGRSIATSSDSNTVDLKDMSGMDILHGISICCHYKEEKETIVKEIISKGECKEIIALSEMTGIYVRDDESIVIGKKPAYLFTSNSKKQLEVGKRL